MVKKRLFLKDNLIQWHYVIVASLVFWGLAKRFSMRWSEGFEQDEACILHILDRSFGELLKTIPITEFTSYLAGDFYLVFPFLKLFGMNKWGLALPHIIITLFGFYFLWQICRLYFKTSWGYIITFAIVSLNATLVQFAFQIRTYAVLPTLALGVFYFMHQLAYGYRDMNLLKKTGIGAFFVIVLWFHVHGVVMVFFSYLYFLIMRRREEGVVGFVMLRSRLFLSVFLIAMPLWLYSVFGPHNVYYYHLTRKTTFAYIPNPMVNFFGFFKVVICTLIGVKTLYILFIGSLVPFILRDREGYQQIGFLLLLIVLPIQLMLSSAVKNGLLVCPAAVYLGHAFFCIFSRVVLG